MRRSFVTVVGLCGLVAGSLVGATPRSDAAPAPTPITFKIAGRGWGHGRGMSQYGAREAAKAGKTWQQIAAFYYPNTVLVARGGSTIRVGLSGHVGSSVRVAAEAGLTASDGVAAAIKLPTTLSGKTVTGWDVAPNSAIAKTPLALWARIGTSRVSYRTTTATRWTITPSDGTLTVQKSSGAVAGHYLGALSGVRSSATSNTVTPVLTTSLENYTRQVVPWESVPSWPVQALAAQAVAARSYASYFQAHPRSASYDICDTDACQVFGGLDNESANSRAGVAASAGKILTYAGQPVLAEFGPTNGGATAGGPMPYQVAKLDPNESTLAPSIYSWSASVTSTTLQAAYPKVGVVRSVQITSRNGVGAWGGRVNTLVIKGSLGQQYVSVSAFRQVVGSAAMRSSLYNVTRP